jgi:ribulose kinase
LKYKYTIGIDLGTESAWAVVVNTKNRDKIVKALNRFVHWKAYDYCDSKIDQFRQLAQNHIASEKKVFIMSLKDLFVDTISIIRAISVASTRLTPVAKGKVCTPLTLTNVFENNPNANIILFKNIQQLWNRMKLMLWHVRDRLPIILNIEVMNI